MGESIETQAVVIGAGPGGYVCAIRLAQLGVKTLLVEKGPLGGVCLNVGCIPSKALISASKLVTQIGEADSMGITAGPVSVDLDKLIGWKEGIVHKLTTGVGQLVKANGGTVLHGLASFTGPLPFELLALLFERDFWIFYDNLVQFEFLREQPTEVIVQTDFLDRE